MKTIFKRIIDGEIPCYKIREDEEFLAFLDIRPIYRGHTLVIPKIEIDNFFDLPDDLLGKILIFSKPIAQALACVVPCRKVGMMVAGLEVPHAHLHLVPIQEIQDLNFANAKPAKQEELASLAQEISQALAYILS